MGVRDQLERVAAWFGFGVDEDDYYEEEEERRPYAKDRYYGGETVGSSHLRAVPDQRVPPTRVSVVDPSSFNDAQALADRFKRQQPVILNLQQADGELSRRMVDFCAGLTYALDGQIQTVANRA